MEGLIYAPFTAKGGTGWRGGFDDAGISMPSQATVPFLYLKEQTSQILLSKNFAPFASLR
jgi:hypothetical protein